MRDRETVAAFAAGEPAGLAAAYLGYAAVLHAYCRSMLATPADAADALCDTFIVATAKLTYLRNPDLVRPWLYAVARNECHRRLRARADPAIARRSDARDLAGETSYGCAAGAGGTAAGPTAADSDRFDGAGAATGTDRFDAAGTADAVRSEPRELVAAAIASLSPTERDMAELHLRHDLDDAGLAATLGVPRRTARALASRARKQFEASLAALLIVRAGPEFCPELTPILAGWDGELSAPLRKRLNEHIRSCAVCGERKQRKLQSTVLRGLPPVLALPDSVWRQVIRFVTNATAGGAAYCAHVAQRAEPFRKSGFPVPLDPPVHARVHARSGLAAVTGAAALAALGTGAVLATGAPHHGGTPHHPPPAAGLPATAPAPLRQVPPVAAVKAPAPPSAGPMIVPVGSAAAPAPTTIPFPRQAWPSASTPPPPTVAPGTLTVQPTTVVLARRSKDAPPTGSFTLTANGGPVAAFVITVLARDADYLTVTPVTGSLAAGESIRVGVTLRKGYRQGLHTQLVVQPGGLTVTVIYQVRPGPT